jgi:serine/threonine-protein kinase
MELLDGETVGARMRKLGGRIPLLQTLAIVRQVANALSAAHAKNIVHRDLKPDNIMLVADPAVAGGERAKLLDFGIAKLRDPNLRKGLTKGDSLLGTPAYMSPEQCKGGVEVSDRADVYSLGVILYRLLAGRLPFVATGGGELLGMHQFQQPTPLSSLASYLPASVVDLIQVMMSKDPAQRPSMSEVDQGIGALQSALASFVQPSLPQMAPDPGESDDDEHEAATIDSATVRPLLPMDLQFAPLATPVTPQTPGSTAPLRVIGSEDSASVGYRSTMNLAASENSSPSSRIITKKRYRALAMLPLVLGLGVVGWLMIGRQKPTVMPAMPPEVMPVIPQKVEPPRRVHWQILTTPVHAEILRVSDGAILGRTPWQGEQPLTTGTEELRIVAPGYVNKLVVLDRSRDEQQTVTLDVLPEAGAAAAVVPTGKGQPKAFKGDANKKKKKPQFEIEE